MNRTFTVLLSLIIAGGMVIGIGPQAGAKPSRPCQVEDGKYCVWDAKHMGNGKGDSYWVDRRGGIHYVSHRTAHSMINR